MSEIAQKISAQHPFMWKKTHTTKYNEINSQKFILMKHWKMLQTHRV